MVEGAIAPANKFLVVLARVLAVGMHQGYADVVSAIITAVALGRHDGLRVRVAPAGAHLASRIPAFLHELLRSPDAYSDAEHGSRLDWDEQARFYSDGAWAGVDLAPAAPGRIE